MSVLTESAAWKNLRRHAEAMRRRHLRDLFAVDPQRFLSFSLGLDDLLLDYSKNLVDVETMGLLVDLARAADVEGWRDRMWRGEPINDTEKRPALHVALRSRGERSFLVDGKDVMPAITAMLERMRAFTDAVRDGAWRGHAGGAITDIVNIGVGGSDLGPRLACEALQPYQRADLRPHFVANVDGADLLGALAGLDPARTLFIVTSKSFATEETMTNAAAARAWLTDKLGKAAVAKHFVAVSANPRAAADFGIAPAATFEFWDWVGGRYSLWSVVGLPVALAIGFERFEDMLAGANAMDEHFRTAPLALNMPVVLAVIGIWHRNFMGAASHAMLPYDHTLRRLPAYLRQLEMESNGKTTRRDGASADYATAPVVWGEAGTIGQHAFHQFLHQGSDPVPADFIAGAISRSWLGKEQSWLDEQHDKLLANYLAQTEALAFGTTDDDALPPHRRFAGNRSTTTILYRQLTPFALGRLLALYEHKTFAQGAIWGLNSFDQPGVELGKQLARRMLPALAAGTTLAAHDSSTRGLVDHIKALRASREGSVVKAPRHG